MQIDQQYPAGAKGPARPTIRLTELDRGALELAGGKGANLGELIRAGFPVPAGFVVTTDAYRRFVEANELEPVIADGLESKAGSAIRQAFETSDIPPELADAIIDAYAGLGRRAVAVRSSATAEDLPHAAFAGQQDTYLGISGAQELLRSVRRCWASLWTDRAIAYRSRLGLDQTKVRLAVVVQQMVPAVSAGVMFTANPVTGEKSETVIDASPGLGEAVVSGLVTPDHFVLQRRALSGWRIVGFSAGKRELVIRTAEGSGTEQVRGNGGDESEPSLTKGELSRLAGLGARIERHYGAPQDIEWAIADGTIWIVQARPITVLPDAGKRPSRKARTFAALLAELVPSRPFPLEQTTWGFSHGFTALLGPVLLSLGIEPHAEYVFEEREGVVVRFSGRLPIRVTPRVLLAPIRLRTTSRHYDASSWESDPLLTTLAAEARRLEATDVGRLGWRDLLRQVPEGLAVTELAGELRRRYLAPRFPAFGLLRLVVGLLGSGADFGTLVFTGQETKTIEANRRLAQLATIVRSEPQLAELFRRCPAHHLWEALQEEPKAASFLADLERFLEEFGHRETGGTMQLSQPTWKEEPAVVLGIIKGLAGGLVAGEEWGEPSGMNEWKAVRDELLGHPLLRFRPFRDGFLRLLRGARLFPLIREDTRFYGTMPLPGLRNAVAEIGRRLVQAGVLDDPQDVFHLEFAELEALPELPPSSRQSEELRASVESRRATRAALEEVPLIPPRYFELAGDAGDALVQGIPGSPGVTEGSVRVIASSADFGELRHGEVLVAPFTNPAWTPLFERAAAVVVDSGGAASHAAIVAREYGIPAVMATGDGTRKLSTGMTVRVDGSAGLVFERASSTVTRSSTAGGAAPPD